MTRELIIIVLLAISALVCLIFFVFTLLEILRQQIKKKQNVGVLKISFVVVFLLIVVAVIGDMTSTTTSFSCGKCHNVKKQYLSWKTGSHKDVSCANCHQAKGIIGSVSYKIKAFNDLISWVSFSKTENYSNINNSNCLSCHTKSSIDNGKTIKVRHKDFIDKYRCSFCHSNTGHRLSKTKNIQVMILCFKCHKSQKKSTNCSFCHKIKKNKNDIKKVVFHKKHGLADPKICKICHKNKSFCIKCHGGGIPHPDFFGLQHSRLAKIPGNKCQSCHTEKFCKDCHKVKMPHPSNYLGVHMKEVYKLGKKVSSSSVLKKVYRAGKKACFNCHLSNDCVLACHDRHSHPGKIREQWLR